MAPWTAKEPKFKHKLYNFILNCAKDDKDDKDDKDNKDDKDDEKSANPRMKNIGLMTSTLYVKF